MAEKSVIVWYLSEVEIGFCTQSELGWCQFQSSTVGVKYSLTYALRNTQPNIGRVTGTAKEYIYNELMYKTPALQADFPARSSGSPLS